MLRNVALFLAGLALGAALWWYGTPAYNGVLAFAAQPLLHLDHRFASAVLTASGRMIRITAASIPSAQIPADQDTANMVLLFALFAMRRGLFRDRGIRGFVLSIFVLIVTHIVAVVVTTEATYALRITGWNDRHYSGVEQDVWEAVEFVYRIGAMFAIPFACYWVTSPDKAEEPKRPTAKKKAKRR